MKYLMGVLSYTGLKLNMSTISRGFLRKGLTKKVGSKEPSLSVFLRTSSHVPLMELVSSLNLDGDYKAYVSAIVLKHEKNFKAAYRLIENINNKGILEFRTKLLYDMKEISGLASLANKGEDVLLHLSDEQKANLIGYLTSRNMYDVAEEMIQSTKVEKDFLIQQLESDKENVFLKYNWNSYKENILGISEKNEHKVDGFIDKIDDQNNQMRDLGYVLMINHFYGNEKHYGFLNEKLVPYFKEKSYLYPYLEPIALHSLNFEIDEENTKSIQLQKMLNYYHSGNHSKQMVNSLLQLIPLVHLNNQHLMSLRRMIIEGHLDINDQEFQHLLKKDRRLHSIFHYPKLFADKNVNEKVDKFIFENLNIRDRRRVYNQVVKHMIHIKNPVDFPFNFVEYLKETEDKRLANAYILTKYYYTKGEDQERENLILRKSNEHQFKIRLYLAKYLFYLKDYQWSIYETLMASYIKPNHQDVIRSFIRNYHVMGNISRRFENIEKMKKLYSARLFPGEYNMAKQEYELLNSEWNLKSTLPEATVSPENKKILFVLNKALPVVNGYTIRSHEIVKGVRNEGYSPIVTTRLGWSPEHDGYDKPSCNIDDITTYYIDRSDKYLTNKTPLIDYFDVYAEELLKIIKKEEPGIIHAASNFQNALPALKVGASMGIPTVYEVRGLWHYTQSEKNPDFYKSERFQLQDNYEIYCCRVADKVTCISHSLKNYLVDRGIPSEKITVIPNGVDTTMLQPSPKADDIIEKYGLENAHVIGFIGSLTSYEGIELILEAMKDIKKSKQLKKKLKFIIVGDGQYRSELENRVTQLELQKDVMFVGKVPHEEVAKFYSIVDIAPFPRKNEPVCQLVTPIKTYEAMAMEKRVIVSDVDALKEMVQEGVNGLLFEADNVEALKEAILTIIDNDSIGSEARKWVIEHREWKVLINALIPLYEKAI